MNRFTIVRGPSHTHTNSPEANWKLETWNALYSTVEEPASANPPTTVSTSTVHGESMSWNRSIFACLLQTVQVKWRPRPHP